MPNTLLRTLAALVMALAVAAITGVPFLLLPTAHAATPAPSLPRGALSGSPLLADAIHSGSVHVSSLDPRQASGNPPLVCLHAPCVLPNVQASGGNPPGTRPVNETPIVTNPRNQNALLTGGNDFNCLPSLVGLGFYTTSNRGHTWKSTCMTPLPNECTLGNPGVGYDLKGVAYISGLNGTLESCALGANAVPNATAIERSTNNGATWSAPILAVSPIFPGGEVDRDWLQVDDHPRSPHANALYLSTTQFQEGGETGSTIAVSHSTDGGLTWSTSVVDTVQTFPVVDQFSDLAIAKDGTVYVTWLRCTATGPLDDCADTVATFYLSKSTDGGITWSTPTPITTAHLTPNTCIKSVLPGNGFYGCLPNTPDRMSNFPVIGVQNADTMTGQESSSANCSCRRAAHLFVVFYNWTGTFMQVEVVRSTDGGKTWGKPVPVAPPTDTHDQFLPWLSVSPDGIIGVSWLDRRNDPANISYEAFAAVSRDGIHFSKNVQIASQPSNPFNDGLGGVFIGDLTGNSWFGHTLYAAWMDSRNGVSMQNEVGGLRLKKQPRGGSK
jgi:hypothetical protein